MDFSIRSVASGCLGKSGDISVRADLFGYPFGTPKLALSVARQCELATGKAFDVNVIIVAPGGFSSTDFERTQYALQFARNAYSQADVGIRRVTWFQIDDADAGGYAVLDTEDEAAALTDDWSGPEGALDLFVVRVIIGFYGKSVRDGDCADHSTKRMSGSVVSLNCFGPFPSGIICEDDIGTTFGHEMGHYLGLEHDGSLSNLMGDPDGLQFQGSSALSAAQRSIIANHACVSDQC